MAGSTTSAFNRACPRQVLATWTSPTVTAVTANGRTASPDGSDCYLQRADDPATISPSSIQLKTAAGAAVGRPYHDSANRRAPLTDGRPGLGATYTVVHGDSGSVAVMIRPASRGGRLTTIHDHRW